MVHGGLVEGVLRGLLESTVMLGVCAAELTSTRNPGDVGAVDTGVDSFEVVEAAEIKRSIAAI